jgi:predicted ATP-dependent endonuclease of OLD family
MEQDARTVLLVEGVSDRHAIETLAERQGRDLEAEGVSVVAMGGAQAIGRFLELYGPRGQGLKLAGLCDVQEEDDFRRGLERAGFGSNLTHADMERLGFYNMTVGEAIRFLGLVTRHYGHEFRPEKKPVARNLSLLLRQRRCGRRRIRKPRLSEAFEGGAYRDRTGDLRLAKPALSQLS